MIIGTIALLTILFGGVDPFLIDRLDKGVKTYVVEESRKDEILTITKQHKKDVKAFDKLRRTRIKEFKKLDRLEETKASDLENFFAQLPPERIAFQDQAIENRLVASSLITPEEWVLILGDAGESVLKSREKREKKEEKAEKKGKQAFPKTRKAMQKYIDDSDKQALILASLDKLVEEFLALEEKIISANVLENSVIARLDADREELKAMHNEWNQVRQVAITGLVDFYVDVRENTDASELDPIMKAFNKDLSITSR